MLTFIFTFSDLQILCLLSNGTDSRLLFVFAKENVLKRFNWNTKDLVSNALNIHVHTPQSEFRKNISKLSKKADILFENNP